MKIPFNIKFRPQIERGEYKVETRDGRPVRIICWDRKYGCPICGLAYEKTTDCEKYVNAYENGVSARVTGTSENDDLFLITPDPELTEFENKLSEFVESYELAATDYKSDEYKSCNGNLQLIINKYAAELLALAKKELVDDIQLQFDDEINESYYRGRKEGKAEALKDLPKWKKAIGSCFVEQSIMHDDHGFYTSCVTKPGCRYITHNSLKKLPGFDD